MISEAIAKKCNYCRKLFTAAQLLTDPEISIIGIGFAPGSLNNNYYWFKHSAENCGTTFMVNVELFADRISEPIPQENVFGQAGCNHQCSNLNDLSQCVLECRFAPFRRFILQTMTTKMKTTRSNQEPA